MKQITVDTCGLLCPQPLIKTRAALKEATAGDEMVVITDNQTALGNLQSYLGELKISVTLQPEEGRWRLLFTVPAVLTPGVQPEAHCSLPATGDYVLVLKSQFMGMGDDALGAILTRAYLNALPQTDRLPSAIILYNGGVKLACEEPDTIAALTELERRGVSVYACGTCLDFYGLKDRLAVGVISNMFKIAELVAAAGHVVYP